MSCAELHVAAVIPVWSKLSARSGRQDEGARAVDIAVWLRSLGLEQYEAAFRENAVDTEVLPSLTAEDLKEIGVAAVGHRRKLLEAIAALRGGPAAAIPPAAVAPQDEVPEPIGRVG